MCHFWLNSLPIQVRFKEADTILTGKGLQCRYATFTIDAEQLKLFKTGITSKTLKCQICRFSSNPRYWPLGFGEFLFNAGNNKLAPVIPKFQKAYRGQSFVVGCHSSNRTFTLTRNGMNLGAPEYEETPNKLGNITFSCGSTEGVVQVLESKLALYKILL